MQDSLSFGYHMRAAAVYSHITQHDPLTELQSEKASKGGPLPASVSL